MSAVNHGGKQHPLSLGETGYVFANIGNIASAGVQVMGIPIDKIGKVNRFPQSLYLQYNQYVEKANAARTKAEKEQWMRKADEAAAHPQFKKPLPDQAYRDRLPRAPGMSHPGR